MIFASGDVATCFHSQNSWTKTILIGGGLMSLTIMKALRPIVNRLEISPGQIDLGVRLFDEWCKKRNAKMILLCTIHQIEKQMPITLNR